MFRSMVYAENEEKFNEKFEDFEMMKSFTAIKTLSITASHRNIVHGEGWEMVKIQEGVIANMMI